MSRFVGFTKYWLFHNWFSSHEVTDKCKFRETKMGAYTIHDTYTTFALYSILRFVEFGGNYQWRALSRPISPRSREEFQASGFLSRRVNAGYKRQQRVYSFHSNLRD